MDVFEQFRGVIDQRHKYAQEWRERTGGKVVGYLCTYAPEEVIVAAGALPVRILGSHEPENVTAPYLYGMFCPYCRDTLAQGLLGRYDYLDGIVHGYCCIHIRQTYDSWVRHLPTPFKYFVYVVDHLESPRAVSHLAKELTQFQKALEEWLGKPVGDQDIKKAIRLFNTNRRLTGELYSLQRSNPPKLHGAEVLEMVLAGQLMDKREHNRLLRQALKQVEARVGQDGSRPRLMLVASQMDDVEFVRLIESLGADIVVDDNCVGTRYFLGEIANSVRPLEAIARRYATGKPLCPVKDISTRERKRAAHIVGLAQEYGVQGMIFAKAKFCDPHEYDIPGINAALNERGIPSLTLEVDIVNPIGQFRTRIEAFLEMLRAEMA